MKRFLITVLSGLVWAYGPVATAALIITALPQPLLLRDEFFGSRYSVDLDSNGSTDVTFGYNFQFIGLRTEQANRVVITLDPPPNIGGSPYQIAPAYLLGSTLGPLGSDTLLWSSTDFIDGFVSLGDTGVFTGIVQVLSTGSSSAFNGRGFIGVEFESALGIHYGYLDIEAIPGFAGITLYGWAWEQEPGKAILAGQVPEPSSLILFGFATTAILARRNRK